MREKRQSDFGNRLRRFVEDQGMTNREFIEKLGISDGTFYNMCAYNSPTSKFIHQLIEHFPDVDLNKLLKEPEYPVREDATLSVEEDRNSDVEFFKKNIYRLVRLIEDL